jgi:site-specific DNA-cytosine methylase
MPGKQLRKISLISFAIAVSSCACITVPITTHCSVAGKLAAGMDCSDSTGKITELSLEETIEFLEPDELTGRAGAICQSTADYTAIKTALDQACRKLGKACSYALRTAAKDIGTAIRLHSRKPIP